MNTYYLYNYVNSEIMVCLNIHGFIVRAYVCNLNLNLKKKERIPSYAYECERRGMIGCIIAYVQRSVCITCKVTVRKYNVSRTFEKKNPIKYSDRDIHVQNEHHLFFFCV